MAGVGDACFAGFCALTSITSCGLFDGEDGGSESEASERAPLDVERDLLTELATNYGASPGILDSLEQSPDIRQDDGDPISEYPEAMRENAANIVGELGCD